VKKKLFKSLIIFLTLFITFFCFKTQNNAASFAYADFDWDEFLKQNKNAWVEHCRDEDEDCVDEVLKTKEKFYKRLYHLLAEFERKGFKIDDNIIISNFTFSFSNDNQ
jgi:hypothetical protein